MNSFVRVSVLGLSLITAHCGQREKEASEVQQGGRVAALREVVQLFKSGQILARPVLLGHVLPVGAQPQQVTQSFEGKRRFTKVMKSILGQTLVELEYEINYQFAGKLKNEGAYLTNVVFIPRHHRVGAGYEVEVKAFNVRANQLGRDGVAVMKFDLSFSVKGIGAAEQVVDSFVLSGKDGALHAQIENFR